MHTAVVCCLKKTAPFAIANAHVTEETIENYEFRRLSAIERTEFEAHVRVCSECATKLHNERMFIYAMKAALASKPRADDDSAGGTFAATIT